MKKTIFFLEKISTIIILIALLVKVIMQEHDRNILDADPPFLILFADKKWKLAIELVPHPQGIAFIEAFHEDQPDSAILIPGSPWHVGENVWEFDYATQVMTLDHPSYHNHPAWQLWLYWRKHQSEKAKLSKH